MLSTRRSLVLPLLGAALALTTAQPLVAQDLGFLSAVFARVHRMSLFVQSLDPFRAKIIDRSGNNCITLALCGAGTEVLIDLDTRSSRLDLELGFGAGYLRSVRGRTGDSLEIRGALRTLPNISTHLTYNLGGIAQPFLTGSFGLVDLWNGRAHLPNSKQVEVRANAFEYGLSIGTWIAPGFTNGRMLLQVGYRARQFASLGYQTTEPLVASAPRSLDMSGWQMNAGWQIDLRPLDHAPQYAGLWVLTRVESANLPVVLVQERSGQESQRTEIVNGYLEFGNKMPSYSITVITRVVTLSTNGVAQSQRYAGPMVESGSWERDGAGVKLTALEPARAASTVVRADDEVIVTHSETGRRLHFRKAKG